eukprot:1392193-Amorphochlora_amoeboformis.AAC.2
MTQGTLPSALSFSLSHAFTHLVYLAHALSRTRSVSLTLCLAHPLSRSRSVSITLCLAHALSRSRSVSLTLCLDHALSRTRSVSPIVSPAYAYICICLLYTSDAADEEDS